MLDNIKSLIHDINGNYVVFKMLEVYHRKKLEPIVGTIEECVAKEINSLF